MTHRLQEEHVQAFEAVESGNGRILVGRLHPGADLILGLEAVCDAHEVRFAAINAAYGSLTSAGFKFLQLVEGEERPRLVGHKIDGRVEFMGGQGLICERPDGSRETHLHGSVSDANGVVTGGHFNPGENPVYNNMDFVIQELLGVRLIRVHDPVTDTIEMQVESLGTSSDDARS
jgi:predicted DNA-binding protein with PD1-like motif